MYVDDIKIFAKNGKEEELFYINDKNVYPRYRNNIWDCKMHHTRKSMNQEKKLEEFSPTQRTE